MEIMTFIDRGWQMSQGRIASFLGKEKILINLIVLEIDYTWNFYICKFSVAPKLWILHLFF